MEYVRGKAIMMYETHINNGVRTGEAYNEVRNTYQ
jgi:hypothetical protein